MGRYGSLRGILLFAALFATALRADPPDGALRERQNLLQSPERIAEQGLLAGLAIRVVAKPKTPGYPTGDFYRLVMRPDGRVSFFLGDATHHGNKAARVSVMLHRLFGMARMQPAFREATAHGTLAFLDAAYQPNFPEPLLVLGHALIDPRTGQIDLASAGLNGVALVRSADGKVTRLKAGGRYPFYPINGESYRHRHFEPVHHQMRPGDILLLTTDGISDATHLEGGRMQERLELIASSVGATCPNELASAILAQMLPSGDDATLVAIQWKGTP